MKRIVIAASTIAAMTVTAMLSLKHANVDQEIDGEIRHFDHPSTMEKLRFHDGQTLEEVFAKKIHLRLHPHTSETLRSSPLAITARSKSSAKTIPQEGVLLTHEVVAGETIDSLASAYHLTPYQIRKLNHLDANTTVEAGEVLHIIPGMKPAYRVRAGDTPESISQRFGVDFDAIRMLNHFDQNGSIWAGQKLVMPLAQKTIDRIVANAKKEQETQERKRRYERELIARLARQKALRKRRAKAKEAAARKAKEAAARKQKETQAEKARIDQARNAFKFTNGKKFKRKLRVVATAYTSHRSQTDSTPFLAAWNNRIRPGMKIIAVSPDLIRKYGITNGVRVKIGGLPGTYVVRDKMNPRLHNHIDIYMGTDRRRALRWGRRRVVLYW